MTPAPPMPPERAPELDTAALSRLGITRVAAENFHVGPYRYSNLADALAQAKRGRIADNDL